MPVPSWLDVHPQDFVRATEAGTQTGLEGLRIAQTGQLASARLAQDAAQHADAVRHAEDALNQQAVIAQMETEARTKISEQNHMQEMQQHAIQNAYDRQRIDIAGGTLQREQAAAADKARQAAMIFQHTQGYAQEVANGVSPAIALSHYPLVGTAAASMLQRAEAEKNTHEVKTIELPDGSNWAYREGLGGIHPIKTPAQQEQEANRKIHASINQAAFRSELKQLDEIIKTPGQKTFKNENEMAAARQKIIDKYSPLTSGTGTMPGPTKVGKWTIAPLAPEPGNDLSQPLDLSPQ